MTDSPNKPSQPENVIDFPGRDNTKIIMNTFKSTQTQIKPN